MLASISPTNDYDDGGLGEPEKTSRRPQTTPSTTARSYKDDNIQPQKPTKKYKDTLGIIDRFNNKVVMYFIADLNQLNSYYFVRIYRLVYEMRNQRMYHHI